MKCWLLLDFVESILSIFQPVYQDNIKNNIEENKKDITVGISKNDLTAKMGKSAPSMRPKKNIIGYAVWVILFIFLICPTLRCATAYHLTSIAHFTFLFLI